MIFDLRRTEPLRRAIDRTVQGGNVVLDIGTGIGLLAFFACRAGAAHVYAVDCDRQSIEVARHLARRFGLNDRITFIEDISFLAKVNEKVDVMICETVGSTAFDENILASIKDGKERFLKRGGRIIPQLLELWGALVDRRGAYGPAYDLEGLDIAPDGDPQIPQQPIDVSPSALLTKPFLIGHVDTNKYKAEQIKSNAEITVEKKGFCNCVAVWPKVIWAPECETDCSPMEPPTHWKQTLLEVEGRSVKPGEIYRFEFIAGPHPEDRWMHTETLWKLH